MIFFANGRLFTILVPYDCMYYTLEVLNMKCLQEYIFMNADCFTKFMKMKSHKC